MISEAFKKISVFKTFTTSVGLDIGSYSLKLAKMRKNKGQYELLYCGIKEIPPGTIAGSEIKNREVLLDSIVTLINQCDPSISDVIVSMSGFGIITDKINIHVDPTSDPEEIILWEAGQRSPFDVDDITLDYKILNKNEKTNTYEVLLVAAKNKIMQSYIDLLYEANLRPVIIDGDAFAIKNAYMLGKDPADLETEGVVVLINIGEGETNVIFSKNGQFLFNRDCRTAGESFAKNLQKITNVDKPQMKYLLSGRFDSSVNRDDIKKSVQSASEELAVEIDSLINYFKQTEKNEGNEPEQISKIVLSGGGALIKGIKDFFEKRFKIPLEISNPLEHLKFDIDLFGKINPAAIAPLLTVCIGLAMRDVK